MPANTVRQIILNLVLNACQATPHDAWAAVSIVETPGAIVLQVEDMGPGMPPAARRHADRHSQPAGADRQGHGTWFMDDQPPYSRARRHRQRSRHGRRAARVVTVVVPTRQEMELSHVA